MRLQLLMFSASSIALIAAAEAAQAEPYFSIHSGLNFLRGSQSTAYYSATPTSYTTLVALGDDADTGFVIGGALGITLNSVANGLRAEIEGAYRRQSINGDWQALTITAGYGPYLVETGSVDGHTSVFSLTANIWYDIPVSGKIKPYLGGGIGWARSRASGDLYTSLGGLATGNFDAETDGFVFQLGAGFNYQLVPGILVGLGYRYMRGPDFEFDLKGKYTTASGAKLENENHSVMANINIGL